METLKKGLAENVKGGNKVASGKNNFTLDDVPDLSGKVAVVTGGSEGIGYGCTHTMLSRNIAKLFILSARKEVIDGAVDAITEEMGGAAAKKVRWLQCDLADWNLVGQTGFQIRKETDRLDILINNAGRGIMTQDLANGVDRHMALNYIGHVVLTSHLLPLLKETAEQGNTVRIVNMSSNAHQAAPKDVKFASLDELNSNLGPNAVYGRSKLAAILYSKYLTRHLHSSHPGILINATHPGFVQTKMSTQDILEPYPLGGYEMKYGMAPFKKDQFEGAQSTMYAATVTEASGEYICPPAIVEKGSDAANNEELEENLMKLTRELVQQKTKSESSDRGCPVKDY
jgi:NAD(P)-dependent dehydrogenase (short-subunit alcohol dehydrogenase family)